MKIAIIGTGNLGSSIAKGLIKNNSFASLYLSDKNTANVDAFNSLPNVVVTNDNLHAVEQSDAVVHRQYRLSSYSPSQSPHSQLPFAKMP